MLKIAHLVHPGDMPAGSDLTTAQPITLASMEIARSFAAGRVEVDLVAVRFADEHPDLPGSFRWLPELTRSVLDLGTFETPRKLALLDDLLRRAYDHTDADFLIYTNIDIALQPHFYRTVAAAIEAGYDAFTINRRTIPDHYDHPDQLPLMWAEVGRPHPGHDCFVFRREAFARFALGDVCIGTGWVGRVLLWNLICFGVRFRQFTDLHTTFHLGDSQVWRRTPHADYLAFNREQARRVHARLQPHAAGLAPAPKASHARFIRQLQRPFGPHVSRTERLRRRGRRLARRLLAPLLGGAAAPRDDGRWTTDDD